MSDGRITEFGVFDPGESTAVRLANDNAEQLFRLWDAACRMRVMQRAYHSTGSQGHLRLANKLEGELDGLIAEIGERYRP